MTTPFIIAGCGRSGTMGMSRLLNLLGVRTSFEEFFQPATTNPLDYPAWLERTNTVGEVNGLSPPYLRELKGVTPPINIIHQVRNPVAVIASLMGLKTWTDYSYAANVKFNFRHIPMLQPTDDPLTLSIKYWLEWNRFVEEQEPIMQYRVEDMPEAISELLAAIGATVPPPRLALAVDQYQQTYNHGGRDTCISWIRIPDSQLKDLLFLKATQYGYTAEDLDGYCPCGSECPHCGGPLEQGQGAYMVRIQPEFKRWMRKHEGSGGPNADYIQGLIDFYRAARVWRGKAVEVGSWSGESAEIAAQFVGHLTCVDPWEPPNFSDTESLFDERMAAYPNVSKLKKPSVEACHDFEDESLDIVYIDAMHDYKHVKEDILCWLPKIKIGGYIGGHDYDDMETHTGIVQAVNELLGKPQQQFADSSWLFKKTPVSKRGKLKTQKLIGTLLGDQVP